MPDLLVAQVGSIQGSDQLHAQTTGSATVRVQSLRRPVGEHEQDCVNLMEPVPLASGCLATPIKSTSLLRAQH